MHNLHQSSSISTSNCHNNGVNGVDSESCNIRKLNLTLSCETTNKSMSLSHPSLSQTLSRSSGKYLTTVDRSCIPLWTTLTTAQVITADEMES